MSSHGVPDPVKLPFPRRDARPDDLSETLLTGGPLPADAPAGFDEVARVLAAATAVPDASETSGEWQAVAAFRAAVATPIRPRSSRRKPVLSALLSAKVLAVTAVAVAATGSTAAAAYTTNLPDGLQNVAAKTIGAPPAHKKAKKDKPAKTEKPGETGTPVGPDATGPAHFGLCNAWSHGGLGTDSIALRNLTEAAGGPARIEAFCAGAKHPGNKPTTGPSVDKPKGKPTTGPSVTKPGKPTTGPSVTKPGKPVTPTTSAPSIVP